MKMVKAENLTYEYKHTVENSEGQLVEEKSLP